MSGRHDRRSASEENVRLAKEIIARKRAENRAKLAQYHAGTYYRLMRPLRVFFLLHLGLAFFSPAVPFFDSVQRIASVNYVTYSSGRHHVHRTSAVEVGFESGLSASFSTYNDWTDTFVKGREVLLHRNILYKIVGADNMETGAFFDSNLMEDLWFALLFSAFMLVTSLFYRDAYSIQFRHAAMGKGIFVLIWYQFMV